MTGKDKRKNSANDDASDGGSDSPPPKKTAKRDGGGDDSVVLCELSKNRKISKRTWQGMVVLDIREFYIKDGKQYPGKKGISLTMDQWKVFRDNFKEISQALAEKA